MEKCRICLGNKKTLRSIYDYDKDTTYVTMITSIANVKINRSDGLTDQICRGCCKCLLEAYNFKLLIERSDLELNEKSQIKKIKFNNIKDIKIIIELNPKPVVNVKQEDIQNFITGRMDELYYKNIIIKKIEDTEDSNTKDSQQSVPVLDFLNSIKTEDQENNINNYDNTSDMEVYGESIDDDNYTPQNEEEEHLLRTSTKKKKKVGKARKTCDEDYVPGGKKQSKVVPKKGKPRTEVLIKPVYLKDFTMLRPPNKIKKKYCYTKKAKMCPHCGLMIASSYKLHIHILSKHSGPPQHKCDICDKAYHTPKSLEVHKKNVHIKRDFKCDQCTADFKTKGALESHQLQHTNEKNFVCQICNKKFLRKKTLRQHMLTHNSANKNINCDVCTMSFFTRTALRNHLRIHTGERPYNCEICSQPYSYKHDFNRHCLKKHGVFLKRRSVYIMNEEVLQQERELMRELVLRVNGLVKNDEPISAFSGPKGLQALELAVKAVKARQIPIDFPV